MDSPKASPPRRLAPRRRLVGVGLVVLAGILLAWGASRSAPNAVPEAVATYHGEASFYGEALRGEPTASGEAFNPDELTAAHRTLPLGTRVRVTNLENERSVVVRVNDRGPFHENRLIDLSKAAARRLGMLRHGVASVRVDVLP